MDIVNGDICSNVWRKSIETSSIKKAKTKIWQSFELCKTKGKVTFFKLKNLVLLAICMLKILLFFLIQYITAIIYKIPSKLKLVNNHWKVTFIQITYIDTFIDLYIEDTCIENE